jgi:hypothetical protein
MEGDKMRAGLIGVAVLAASLTSANAQSIWSVTGTPGSASFALIAAVNPPVTYVFDCSSRTHVAITHTAATKLTDAARRRPVPDSAAELPTGAAFMALRVDKADLVMNEAIAERNENGGWDLTIDIPKDDPSFLGLPSAEKVSLMTTGRATSLQLTDEDRAVIADFIGRCTGK